jgi:hypothetical protein
MRQIQCLLILSSLVALNGCAAATATRLAPSLLVIVTPASLSVPVSLSQQFEAVVQTDGHNNGVTWALTQSGSVCSPACGSLSSAGPTHVTYSAPAELPQPPAVTLTAVSVSNATKSSSAQIALTAPVSPPPSVSLSPASISVSVSQNRQFTAVVQNDPKNQGVTWSLSQIGAPCGPACGSLVAFTTQTAIYAAPDTPPSPSVVTIMATSMTDKSQSVSAIINIALPVPGSSDQWVDITHYGARSVDRAPTATAACTAGSAFVTLSNGGWPQDLTQFQNGDSIRLDNCGPQTKMTPPVNVAVSPGMNAGGTPAVPVSSLGTIPYSYQVIACDKSGGCSAASPVATTFNGSTTLGRVTAPILRMSLSNNVMTVTTAGAHGFVPYALAYIPYFSTQTASFEGWYIVSSVPSATSFTFLTSIDSRVPGTPTLDTSRGAAVAFNCNIVSWAAVTDAWKYFIYGRKSGAIELIGVAEPGTTIWQDYGSPMMDNFSFPSFVPRTPPTSAINQYLLTTVVGGAATPSIRLAVPAGNTTSNVTARMGSDAAILAAFKAASAGTVFIPSGTFQVAGYLDLRAVGGPIYVVQAGTIATADTIQIPGALYWRGSAPAATTQFQEVPTPIIHGTQGSYPLVYLGNGAGGSVQFDHVRLDSGALNGTLLLYADSGGALNFDYVQFVSGPGNFFGYMQRQIIFRTGGFDYNFSKCLFIADQEPTGTISDVGYTFLPSVLFVPSLSNNAPTGSIHFQDSWFVGKSAVEVNQSVVYVGASYNLFENTQTQNDPLPVFIASNYPLSNTPVNSSVSFNGFSPADFPSAMTGNWAANTLSVDLQNLANLPTGSRPLAVGNPTVFLGSMGGTASSGPPGGGWFAAGGSQVGYLLPPPTTAPLLTISAGGKVPVGSHTYQVAWIDAFGNSTTAGPSATANIVSGMQTVTVNPGVAPAGAVGWQFYRDGALTGPFSALCGPFELGTSEIDANVLTNCGASVPFQNTAMSSGQGINGEEANQIELTGGGHKTVISGTFSTNRTLNVPDVSGTIAVKIANGTVMMPTDVIAGGSCSAIVNVAAPGVVPSDVVGFSIDEKPQTNANNLRVVRWPSAENVSFEYCNDTSATEKPDPRTLSWQVLR